MTDAEVRAILDLFGALTPEDFLRSAHRLGYRAGMEAAARIADQFMLDQRRARKGDEWSAATGIAAAIDAALAKEKV